MEKIQSAIAKARAIREGRLSGDEAAEALEALEAQAEPGARAPDLPEPPEATLVEPLAPTPAPAPPRAPPAPPAAARTAREALPAAAPPVAVPPAGAIDAPWRVLPALKVDQPLLRRNRIVAFEGGQEAATFDVMRTRLLQQMRANKWRRLAITSPSAGCGKTTTSLNLAFSLSRQSDQRTLLAEVDLRRPALARMLGVREPHSFAQVLEGKTSLAENAVRYGGNLAIATNHAPFRNPAELLHGPTVGPALAAIESRYDPSVVIFDMPPLLVGDDALAFLGHVDCVLLVAAAEATTVEEVDTCERDLAAHTNVLGVILNKCRFPERNYGYSQYA